MTPALEDMVTQVVLEAPHQESKEEVWTPSSEVKQTSPQTWRREAKNPFFQLKKSMKVMPSPKLKSLQEELGRVGYANDSAPAETRKLEQRPFLSWNPDDSETSEG